MLSPYLRMGESMRNPLPKIFAATLLLSMTIPGLAIACSEHATGHPPPVPLDRSKIPASAFLKPTGIAGKSEPVPVAAQGTAPVAAPLPGNATGR